MLNNNKINALTASLLHDVHGTNYSPHVIADTMESCRSQKPSVCNQQHNSQPSWEKPRVSEQDQDKATREAEITEMRMKLESMDRGCDGCH